MRGSTRSSKRSTKINSEQIEDLKTQLTDIQTHIKTNTEGRNVPAYSTITRMPMPENQTKEKEEEAAPVLVIRSNNDKDDTITVRDETRRAAKESKTKITPKELILTRFPKIILKFHSREDAETYQQDIQAHTDPDRITTILPKIKWKSIVLLGAPETTEKEHIKEALVNLIPFTPKHLEITYTSRPNGEKVNHTIETDSTTYYQILRRKRLFIDYESVRIQPNFRTTRCRKCNRYGHTAIRCTNELTCAFCAQSYTEEHCRRKSPECTNCHGTEFPSHHPSFASSCSTYKQMRDKFIKEQEEILAKMGYERT